MNITGRDLEDKYERIMDSLNLYDSIWEDIDINLLLLAFIHPSGEKYIPESMRKKQYDKYLCNNYEWFEFVGDGILEIIVTTIVTEIQDVDIFAFFNISTSCISVTIVVTIISNIPSPTNSNHS